MNRVLDRIGRPATLALAAGLVFAASASAHRTWLLPSATLVEGPNPVVSIDAAVSEDLFEFDTMALQLDTLSVVGPDGGAVAAEARTATKRRVSFDVKLGQKGTYRIAGMTDGMMASWKAGGETKRWRGAPEAAAREVPADAQELNVTRMLGRVETFVSDEEAGLPAAPAAGQGIELQPLSHPTDLSVGDSTAFRLLLDGKPYANADVTVIRGGNRYRYKMGELALKTDAQGKFTVAWPEAGRYWLGASHGGRDPNASAPPPPGTLAAPARRESYSATFEVLPR